MKGRHLLGSGAASALVLVLVAGLALAEAPAATPLGTAFTYQGQLKSDNTPYTGTCDLEFGLWDALTSGTQVGILTMTNVAVDEGLFTVQLDYGTGKFAGDARWLELSVRCPAGSGTYTLLSPRQALTASPYALYSQAAPWSGLTGVPAGFADGTDNDTTYSAGTGLTLSGTTFSANTDYLQRRVSGTCTTGNAIRVIAADGTVTCQAIDGTDNDTTYSAGTGLTLSGTTFSANTDYLQRRVSGTCATGNAIRVIAADGTVTCQAVGGSAGWSLTGNPGTAPGTNYLGTSDNVALELKVNGARALRLEPQGSPNLIGGYSGNWVTAGVFGATIGGGGWSNYLNRVTDAYGTVGGGLGNLAGDNAGTVQNDPYATVAGGSFNSASAPNATIGGGNGNSASGPSDTIGGGNGNSASGPSATIGGGNGNSASGAYATVAGGDRNTASGYNAAVGGGGHNTASGYNATVPGGYESRAEGDHSFAAGNYAIARNRGCFVWGDASISGNVECSKDNQWVARSSGGVYFYTSFNGTTGSYLAAGGNSWNSVSDRATKENFSPADGRAILETLASLPVQEYNLKSQDDSIRHVGLVAQDFAAFGYGESDKAINMQDADGVALAAIQGLYAENQALKAQVASLQQQNAGLDARLTALEQAVHAGRPAQTGPRLPVPWLLAGGLVVAGGGTLAGWRRRPGGRQ